MKKDITVIEVSYEVANKVGGIYTVLASKMARMHENLENYHAIGPFDANSAMMEFEPVERPEKIKELHEAIREKYGIICHYGKLLINENPAVTLVDTGSFRENLNDVKTSLWEEYKIDSLNSDAWFDEPVIWSKAVGIVLEEMLKAGIFKNPVIHFHEWLTGAALLHLKSKGINVPTVFTTHSTVLGRAIAEVGKEGVHEMFDQGIKGGKTVPDEKAYEYHVQAKHLMEKATVANATIFTTVSEAAGKECKFIFGREPDMLLPNGLDTDKFPLMEELSGLHIKYRDSIRRFVMSYFTPYYDIDVKNTLFFFISGRQEIRNKGIDVFIESLGMLNRLLKKSSSKKTIITLIWVPAHTMERKQSLMENMALFETMEETVEKETEEMKERIVESFAEGKLPTEAKIFDEEFLDYMKKMKLQLSKERKHMPPLSAFNLDPDNQVIKLLEQHELLNKEEDKVKVIYYPSYVSVVDGLLNMNYYSAIIGCHLGVFPSYYESWGYTPLETAALGVQSITTDLSGFGKFVQHQVEKNDYGIYVLPREGKSYEEVVTSLTEFLHTVYKMSKEQRNRYKIMAKELSRLSDWKFLIENYMKAYDMAMNKA